MDEEKCPSQKCIKNFEYKNGNFRKKVGRNFLFLIRLFFVIFFCFVFVLFVYVSFQNLFVTPVIVLNNHGGSPFLLLLLGPLASYVGSIGLLDGFGRLVEFALFVIRQRQVRKIANK